jgi:DNA (cytosine-5)-methyltransferase 1
MGKLTVIDFFCGAGGFSEGFRQHGFEILLGIDYWQPAIDTYNHNFKKDFQTKNILDFSQNEAEIEKLPNSDIIIGSPPCVSFSNSNKSGKADKSLGVKLTETFLRIVAVKKHQPNSILKAWYMENVVNSRRYLQTSYTFNDLKLSEWAKKYRISPNSIAINLLENSQIINSADYGSFQARKRVITGEIIKKKKLIVPRVTHSKKPINNLLPHKTLRIIKDNFPCPYDKDKTAIIRDLQYSIEIEQQKITDHFYDTGIYQVEWKVSKHWKVNHPFMGKMSFPENIYNPSRTITATKIANSRESIIYKSEIKRKGDGEYRLPTVREAAIIMGFPLTYQFLGSESNKWRLIGNAVCCSVSRALARQVLWEFGLEINQNLIVEISPRLEGVLNLNNYKRKNFDCPPIKNKGSRFRRQPIKNGNLTVTLSNYDIENNSKADGRWLTSIQYGTGKGYPIQKINDRYYLEIESIIKRYKGGDKFIQIINNGFEDKIGNKHQLQDMYEKQTSFDGMLEPTELVDEVGRILNKIGCSDKDFIQDEMVIFENKKNVPIKQLFALYAINKISTIANNC